MMSKKGHNREKVDNQEFKRSNSRVYSFCLGASKINHTHEYTQTYAYVFVPIAKEEDMSSAFLRPPRQKRIVESIPLIERYDPGHMGHLYAYVCISTNGPPGP